MWFANIFLLIFSLFFHHFNRFSTGQKFLMWVRYNLSIFLLMNHAFDVKSKIPRLLTSPRSKDFLLFFSKGVISLSFTFQSIFHFELIFAEGMRFRSRLSFLPMDISWLQYCLKGHLFFHCFTFASLSKISCAYLFYLLLHSLFCSPAQRLWLRINMAWWQMLTNFPCWKLGGLECHFSDGKIRLMFCFVLFFNHCINTQA